MTAEAKNNPGNHREADRQKPAALILAGYDKVGDETKKKRNKEIIEAYDGDELYIGQNKFLQTLAGKPIIQYVIDAVYNAKVNGEKIYDSIYVYNDIKSFSEQIDVGQYPGLILNQMTDSIGGHWKDFYFNHIDYGQRVDVFFGDTPRITPEDVEYIYGEYSKILLKKKDHRGIPVNMVYAIVEYKDMKDDNWLDHRIKFIKVGANKGKLKHFVGFENFQGRVGNSGALVKDRSMDGLMDKKASNLVYNLRKALTPSTFSKILFYIWKSKRINLVKQIKNKCINETEAVDAFIDIISSVYKLDLSGYGLVLLHIKKNAARWENDIDGPGDLQAFRERF